MSVKKESWSDYIKKRRSIQARFRRGWFLNLSSGIPWLDSIIIIVLLLVVNNRLAIVPGMVFDLPRAPLRTGVHSAYNGLTAVMIPVVHDVAQGGETLIFFDDERFAMQDEDFAERLSLKVRERIHASARHDMLLLADKHIPHGDVIQFVNVVREAGVNRVNVGEKPE